MQDVIRSPGTEDLWWNGEFEKLSSRARRHLPFLGLFISSVSIETLEAFVASGDRQQELYIELVGESLSAAGWEAVLDEAARGGLLLAMHRGLYELIPSVSTFLRRKLIAEVGPAGLQQLGSEFAQFYAAWAAHLEEDMLSGREQALRRVALEGANLLRALRLAEIDDLWELVLPIARALKEHYETAGRVEEWHALRTELLGQVGRELPPEAGRDRTRLWLFLQGSEANDALARNELDQAERTYHRILEVLDACQDPLTEAFRGVSTHQLGLIATERRDLDQAERQYRQALDIFRNLGLERSAADEYYQLGNIAWERRQLDQAEELYRRALAIYERRGLASHAAAVCQQLGRIAEAQQQWDQAEASYLQALAFCEQQEHPLLLFNAWTRLGGLRQRQGILLEAVAYYGQALDITTQHALNLVRQALLNLAGLLAALGEEAFVAAWHEALPGEPPLEAIRKVVA
jgi:tetratricopeptide (TPR) repeat protein